MAVAVAMCSVAAGLSALPGPAVAAQAQSVVVSDNPANFTPHVLDGEVFAIAQAGNKIFLGGTFTQAQNNGSTTVLTRNRILAVNRTTGVIDTAFAPNANSTVRALVAAEDGQSVYVGGQFSTIGGGTAFKVARLDADTGQRVPGFNAGQIDALVYDMELVNGRLFIAGQFSTVGGQPRFGLAELSPTTGAVRAGVNVPFTGTHRGTGSTLIREIAVTPNADRLVAIGNFSTVGGHSRNQLAMLNISGTTAAVAFWETTRYTGTCATFQYYTYDVDFAPNGSYFVVGTTGAYGAPPRLCDTAARWETYATGTGLQPSWVDYTGGDSTYSVEVTGTAVYVGGHQRWWNSPTRVDGLGGPGSVERTGIGALDPVNGLPLSWNPTRTRGRGVFDFLATSDGLWVGSDTDRIGAFEYHARIAFFPLAGGTSVPQPALRAFPVDVHLLGFSGDQSFRRWYNGSTVGGTGPLPGGIAWGDARGAFHVDGQLYTTWSDGTLTRRAYTGNNFGVPTTLDLHGLTAFATEAQTMTGLFYENGRMYFTLSGDPNLYMRYFTVEDGMVGAERFTITGNLPDVDWRDVNGMFLVGDRLYWAHGSTGDLHRVNWQPGARSGVPVGGTDATVDGGHDWRARALFAGPPNQLPVAAFTSACNGLSCPFNGSASTDQDGTVDSYAWDFGDGATATGPTPSHAYASAGTYPVTLTVTDNLGGTDVQTGSVLASANGIQFAGSAIDSSAASATTHTVTMPSSVQTGDVLVLVMSWNSGIQTVSNPSGWTRRRTVKSGSLTTAVWSRMAPVGIGGDPVAVTASASVRGSLAVAAYRNATLVTSDTAVTGETISRAGHRTPTLGGAEPGSWVISYWSDRTSTTSAWTAPTGQVVRRTGAETGTGHLSWLLTDSGGGVPSGTVGGLTATANSSSNSATMGTFVLTPSG